MNIKGRPAKTGDIIIGRAGSKDFTLKKFETNKKAYERRIYTRQLQNARRRALRYAQALRREAKSYARVKTEKGYRTSEQSKTLMKEAARIERYANASTAKTKSGKARSNAAIAKRIEKLNSFKQKSQRVAFENARFEAAMREARRGVTTPEFGEGEIAKKKVQAFYTWAYPYWRDTYDVSERNPAILRRLGVETMKEAYQIFEGGSVEGSDSFWAWVNDRLGTGFDTNDPRFNALIMEAWDRVDSAEKKSISTEYHLIH